MSEVDIDSPPKRVLVAGVGNAWMRVTELLSDAAYGSEEGRNDA